MQPSIVLVLGAGASVAMGYPVGSWLRKEIIEGSAGRYAEAITGPGRQFPSEDLVAFTTAFRDSQMLSIDAFLARRPDMVNIGKRAIAAVLLDKENPEMFHSTGHGDKWYQYFFNQVASESWEKLDFGQFALITFNYDRSLEHYLALAMSASYCRPLTECHQKLASLTILHVYGTLGPLSPADEGYFPYGSGAKAANIDVAVQRLRVIPEGRENDETLLQARRLLLDANHIAFLGFGFDETNLKRLDSKTSCAESVLRADGHRLRQVVATCMDLTVGEVHRALRLTRGSVPPTNPHDTGFVNGDCLYLLRATQVLRGDA